MDATAVKDEAAKSDSGLTKTALLSVRSDACACQMANDGDKSRVVLFWRVTKDEKIVHHNNDSFAASEESSHALLEVFRG